MMPRASSISEACYMEQSIGRQIGVAVTGKMEMYAGEPKEPPEDHHMGITFISSLMNKIA